MKGLRVVWSFGGRERVTVWGFLRIERHIPSIRPICDFVNISRQGRGCCLSVRRMRDVTAEDRVISKEIKRIFQNVSEIIYED